MLRLRSGIWPLCTAIVLGALATRSAAVDHVVEIRCVEDSTGATYRSDRDPVVVAAGTDRITFSLGPYDPCWYRWRYVIAGVVISPALGVGFSLGQSWVLPPAGPFCEAGARRYELRMWEGHGIPVGSFDLGVIEVTPSSEPPSDGSTAPLIGVFADPTATSCMLPASTGRHRAYVCVRIAGDVEGRPSFAEFRVAGFPSEWLVEVVRSAVSSDRGSLLGDGVSAWIGPAHSGPVVVLYVIEYDATTAAASATVRVEAARLDQSTHPKMYFDSDGAVREICAIGGLAYLGGGDTGPCALALQGASWGRVKSLYRDTATR